MPRDYLPVAENAGLMPIVDNVLLVKSVQLLRKLRSDSRVKGVFCNISVQSLLDRDFFPELVEFMEENSGLSESLVFEVSQPAILGLTRGELAALDTLGALGYGFSLDHVGDLDVDFAGLRDRSFRFVKIDATTFLHGMKEKGAALPASDMKGYLEALRPQIDHREGRGRGRRGEAARLRRRACPGLSVRRAQGDEPAACARARRRRRGLIAVPRNDASPGSLAPGLGICDGNVGLAIFRPRGRGEHVLELLLLDVAAAIAGWPSGFRSPMAGGGGSVGMSAALRCSSTCCCSSTTGMVIGAVRSTGNGDSA